MTAAFSDAAFETIDAEDYPRPDPTGLHIWRYTPIDPRALGPGAFNPDEPDEIASNVHARLLAYQYSSRVRDRQFGWMIASFFIAAFGGLFGVVPFWEASWLRMFAFAGIYMLVYLVFVPRLTQFACLGMKPDAAGIIERCFLQKVPKGAPPDLASVTRISWLTAAGDPMASEIRPEDATSVEAVRRARAWWSPAFCIAGALSTLIYRGDVFPALLWMVAIAGLIGFKFWRDRDPLIIRAKMLEETDSPEADAYLQAGGKRFAYNVFATQAAQIATAMDDPSPVLKLGTATGMLAERGDYFAPTQGLPFVLSMHDLKRHTLVTGGVGSGKTSGILRPAAIQAGAWENVGVLLLDGKMAMPREIAAVVPGFETVDPASCTVSLTQDLEPQDIVGVLADLFAGRHDNPFFINGARQVLHNAAVIAKEHGIETGAPTYTLANIWECASDEDYRGRLLEEIEAAGAVSDQVVTAAKFFETFDAEGDSSKGDSGILSTARGWIFSITQHAHLEAWAKAATDEPGLDILGRLNGRKMGFLIPSFTYGAAASVVTALLKARLYAALKRRAVNGQGPGETDVLLIIDEAQEVMTSTDADMLAMGRSLGLAVMLATQTVEGAQVAERAFSVCNNVVTLGNASAKTLQFGLSRLGAPYHALGGVKGTIQRRQMLGLAGAARRQPMMRSVTLAPPVRVLSELSKSLQRMFLPGIERLEARQGGAQGQAVHVSPVLQEGELPDLLAAPNVCLITASRGNAPRRDLVVMRR
ncbi:MAG: hypothetical protein AAFQ84_03645 [Pseudomonadota bacterium]